MRQSTMGGGVTLLLALAMVSLAACGERGSGDTAAAGSGPLPYYQNAALPNPNDLVRFDDRPTGPGQIVELDELGAGQAAFPLYYGTRDAVPPPGRPTAPPPARPTAPPAIPPPPGTRTPPMASRPAERPAQIAPQGQYIPSQAQPGGQPPLADSRRPLGPGTADIVVPYSGPLPSDVQPSALTTTTSSSEGYINYQDYMGRSQAESAARAPIPSIAAMPAPPPLAPPPAAPTDFGAAPAAPVPTANLDELKTARAVTEPVPLPPPPLPELPAYFVTQPDVARVNADFERLKAFCEADDLAAATRVYAAMPNFGENEELNRARADSANLLILGMSRLGNLPAARQVYDSLPPRIIGFDAMLAKARAIINLTTYYVRAERFNDAYSVLMDIGAIQNRSALNVELFRLMARMIPYLDNAEETEKAQEIYDLLVKEVKSPGTAALFSENVRNVIRYYLHFVDNTDSPSRRRKRLDFLEHAYMSLEVLTGNSDIALLRKDIGESLSERYASNPEKAAQFAPRE